MDKVKGVNKPTKNEGGVVEFEDFDKLKRKKVRGLLRKRAKKYECKLFTIPTPNSGSK
jgi:hypothetical protein